MNKWKELENVISGDDKSFGSHHSQEKVPYQSFRKSLENKSERHTPKKNKSFCFDYLQKRKVNRRKQTHNFDVTDPENKHDLKSKQDLFTSMRNAIKDSAIESKIVSKNNGSHLGKKNYAKHTSNAVRYTLDKVQILKKQQKKLKKQLQKEFQGFKNMFYQFEEVSYMHSIQHNQPQKPQQATVETQFLEQMMLEAINVEKIFAQMDRKKEQVMSHLDI